jgi:hypothetical protein
MLKNNLIVAGAKRWCLFFCIVPALMMAVLSGCSSSNHGRLQGSHEVTQLFKNNQILSDHQYYSSGFQRIPYGIIGIANKYKLRSNHWKPINLNPTLLNQLTYRMEHVYSISPRGAWILDPDGNRVGIWYSSRDETTVKIEKNDYVVVVIPRPPDLSGTP